MIELNVTPVLTDEQLEALRFQRLTPAYCKPIISSTRIICEGKLKALFLKAEDEAPITQLSYDAALRGLRAMRFVPASHSRRAAVDQDFGGDLLLGWMNGYAPEREDIFRAGHRDHFVAAFWLVPLLRDFEGALQKYLPEYWQFHIAQAQRLVRPKRERLKTLTVSGTEDCCLKFRHRNFRVGSLAQVLSVINQLLSVHAGLYQTCRLNSAKTLPLQSVRQ